jgi:hypothetical protein
MSNAIAGGIGPALLHWLAEAQCGDGKQRSRCHTPETHEAPVEQRSGSRLLPMRFLDGSLTLTQIKRPSRRLPYHQHNTEPRISDASHYPSDEGSRFSPAEGGFDLRPSIDNHRWVGELLGSISASSRNMIGTVPAMLPAPRRTAFVETFDLIRAPTPNWCRAKSTACAVPSSAVRCVLLK